MALFYLVGIFDLWDGLWTLGISAATAYIMAAYIKDPIMPWMAFVVLMGHMSINHLHRQALGENGTVDITGAQMVLVMKV
jgi:lysophospholipid acyltransferase